MSLCGNTAAYLPRFAASYYDGPSKECNGHGDCIDGLCVCYSGWTGKSDFISTDGITCDSSMVTLHVFWGINLAYMLYCLFITRYAIKAKFEQHREMVQRRAAGGEKYTVLDNKGFAAVLAYLIVCVPSTICMCALMIARDDERLGFTWGMTILFAISRIGFYFMMYFFEPQLLATILRGSSTRSMIVSFATLWGKANFILSVVVSLLPFITLLASKTGRDATAQWIYISYFLGSGISLIIYASQAVLIQRRFNKLTQSMASTAASAPRNDTMREIKRKLMTFQIDTLTRSVVEGCVYMIFLFLPFMYNKHDYFLPIMWLAMHSIYKQLATTTVTTSRVGDGSTEDGMDGTFEHSKSTEHGTGVWATATSGPPSSMISYNPTVRKFKERATIYQEAHDSDESDSDEYV